MGSEWRPSTWGDEISLEYGKSLKGYRNGIGNVRVYGSNGPVGWTENTALADGPGVILGRKGAYRGVQYSEDPFYVIDTAYYVKPKAELDMRWLYYSIIHHKLGEIDDGSPIPSTTRSAVYVTDVDVPPLPEQKAIAHILGTLDDKIELNRRMNATLEGMAQALFKSWFVDFDPVIDNALASGNPIPDELAARAEVRKKALASGTTRLGSVNHATLSDPKSLFPTAFVFNDELGWVPEGWEVSDLEKTTSLIIDHRGKTPRKLASEWVDSGYPAISAKNIKEGKLVRKDTIRFTDSDLYQRWMADELEQGDVLLTSEAPLGEKFYLAKKAQWVLSQRLFALRANEKISGVYLYSWLSTAIAQADIDGRASGTTVQGIRQSELRQVKVLVPSAVCIAAFSAASDPVMTKRASNDESVEQLTKLRDALLPKLISGEIRT